MVGVDGSPESRDAALLGPYSAPGPPITPNFREAPTLLPAPDHKAWYLYYEQYPGVAYLTETAGLDLNFQVPTATNDMAPWVPP